MFNEKDIEKIDKFLRKNFKIIFDFEFNGVMLLFGGAVKDLIMDQEISDLDFILLTQDKDNIKEFFSKYKLDYKENKYKGYRINYNGFKIDISSVDDLYYSGHLSTDRLFYDIQRKQLIPIGIKYSLKKNQVIDWYYQGYFKVNRRIKNAKKFICFMNKSNKRVKVKYKYNRILNLLISAFKHPNKIFDVFSR